MIYEYSGPGGSREVPAPDAAAELQRIHRAHGELTPAGIVDESRPKDAPLHPVFEWKDKVAAEKYREAQARQLVRAIVVRPDPAERERTPTVRAFVSVDKGDQERPRARTYMSTEEALQHPEYCEQVKRRMRHELENMQRRYDDLLQFEHQTLGSAFAGLVDALEA